MGDCTSANCPVVGGYFLEKPSGAGSVFFIAVFAVLLAVNIYAGVRYKTPLFATLIAAGLAFEVMGYVGRLLARENVASKTYFVLYLLGTTVGPAFVIAGVNTVLCNVLVMYGNDLNPLTRPVYLFAFFLIFDIFTLVFQAIGSAFTISSSTHTEMNQGTNILLAGLAMQAVSIGLFLTVFWWFRARTSSATHLVDHERSAIYNSSTFKFFLFSLQLSALLVLARTIVRIVQAAQGLGSSFAQSEVVFLVLDGATVFLACTLLSTVPPGRAFGVAWRATSPFNKDNHNETLPLRRRSRSMRTRSTISSPYAYVSQHSPRHSPKAYRHPGPPPLPPMSPGQPSPLGQTSPRYYYAGQRPPYEITPAVVPYVAPDAGFAPSHPSPKRQPPSMVEADSLW